MTARFKKGGPLAPNDPTYVARDTDARCLNLLRKLEWVILTAPRQQGKTSLAYRVLNQLRREGFCCAYVDASRLASDTNIDRWFHLLCQEISKQSTGAIDYPLPVQDVKSAEQFFEFLIEDALNCKQNHSGIIVFIDEIGNIPQEWAESFFIYLAYMARDLNNIGDKRFLSFCMVGTVAPAGLMMDQRISPFNVCETIYLPNFDCGQLIQLWQQGFTHRITSSSKPNIAGDWDGLINRLYFWSGGQPYISQSLSRVLTENNKSPKPIDVERAAERFLSDDRNHLPPLISRFKSKEACRSLAKRALHEEIPYYPALHETHFEITHVLGLLKPDENNILRVPNEIYRRVLEGVLCAGTRVFVSHCSSDKAFVRKLVDDLLKRDLNVWFDERELKTGDSIVEGIEGGLKNTDYLMVILSKESVNSKWVRAELNAALMNELSGGGTVLLPTLMEDCEIPELLRDRVYADFRKSYERGLASLFAVFAQESYGSGDLMSQGHIPPTSRPLYSWDGDHPGSDCVTVLQTLTQADLRRRISARLSDTEVAEVWFDTFGESIEEVLPKYPKGERVIKLIIKANQRQSFPDLLKLLCQMRPDVARRNP